MTALLHFLNVPSLTPATASWLVGMAVVFAAELAVLWRVTSRQLDGFRLYMGAMAIFPLSFTGRWTLDYEIVVEIIALLASVEAVIRLTGRLRAERRDVIKAILFTALTVALYLWTRNPPPFPEWPKDIYYVRLYSHIACVSMLTVAAWYSFKEKAEPFYQRHAVVLLAWFLILFRADRWFFPRWPAEGWYAHSVIVEALLVGCLVGWWVLLSRSGQVNE